MQEEPWIKEVRYNESAWCWLYRGWYFIHYSLGVIGALAAVGLTFRSQYFTNDPKSGTIPFLDLLLGGGAAACTALVTMLGPLQQANRYRKAFHLLNQSRLEFIAGERSKSSLLREMEIARNIIVSGIEHLVQPTPEKKIAVTTSLKGSD